MQIDELTLPMMVLGAIVERNFEEAEELLSELTADQRGELAADLIEFGDVLDRARRKCGDF